MLGNKFHVKQRHVMVTTGKDKIKPEGMNITRRRSGFSSRNHIVKRHTRPKANQPGGIIEGSRHSRLQCHAVCGKCANRSDPQKYPGRWKRLASVLNAASPLTIGGVMQGLRSFTIRNYRAAAQEFNYKASCSPKIEKMSLTWPCEAIQNVKISIPPLSSSAPSPGKGVVPS